MALMMVALGGISLRSNRSRPRWSAPLSGRTSILFPVPRFVVAFPASIKASAEGVLPVTVTGSTHSGRPGVGVVVAVGVAVGVAVLVGVAVTVGVCVCVAVGVGVSVAVAVGVAVSVIVGVTVCVGV